MSEHPYPAVPTKLPPLLGKIKSVGVPSQVSRSWLQSIGFTSSNDPTMLTVLEFVGLVDSSKQPTDRWMKYRNEGKSKEVLAAGIRQGYSALYEVHREAHRCSEDELKNYFKAHSTAGGEAIRRTLKTFRVLCSLADFGDNSEDLSTVDSVIPDQFEKTGTPAKMDPTFSPELNINIQIHISADVKDDQINKIFSSMATHLFGRDSE